MLQLVFLKDSMHTAFAWFKIKKSVKYICKSLKQSQMLMQHDILISMCIGLRGMCLQFTDSLQQELVYHFL